MFSIFDNKNATSRRAFLRVGGLGLGGLALPELLAAQAWAKQVHSVTNKSVVFLFMHGGPSQFETFDPKMSQPSSIRSMTGEIPTSLPGITYGSTFQKLAKLAHKTSIVRSFTTGDGSHNIKPIVGKNTNSANMGSIYSRIVGTNHPRTGMPTNAALFPRAVAPDAQVENNKFGKFASTGTLGSAYAPFVPGAGGQLQEDMKLALSRTRLDDRRHLLARIDHMRRKLESNDTIDGLSRFQQQAFDTVLSGVASAFDLSEEDPKTIARYDTAGLIRRDKISKRWNNHNNYADHVASLGKLMLLARRLCENGCGFVTVTTNFVWDMHADKNNATMDEGMGYVGVPFDHAVSAFIEDVEARGLQDDILLVCCGEMGRSPKINKNGGRDHWGGLAPLMLYGGGHNRGQVIGQSARDGGTPLTEPMTLDRLTATVMHTLFNPGELRLEQGVPDELARFVANGKPIPGLL